MALEDTLKELRRATFIGKDFNTYVQELSQFVKQRFGDKVFNDFVEADLGIMFLELVAFANSTLSFYLDLQSGESYLETAKLRNSIVRLSRNIGFKMTGAVPASTSVIFRLELPKEFDVPIPAGTQLTSKPGLVFETVGDTLFKKIKNLSGRYFLSKGSNIVFALAGTNAGPEISFGPNGEAETVIKLKDSLDEALRRVISVDTQTSPNRVIIDRPFPDDIFPTDIVVLKNDSNGTAGNQVISETVADSNFTVSGMSEGSSTTPAIGTIKAIAGSLILDGEKFTLNDGVNPAVTFEFDKNSVVTPPNVAVAITNTMTASQVANAILEAINNVGIGLNITAFFGKLSTNANPLIAGDVGPKTVVIHEGETTEEVFLSTGRPNQVIRLQAISPDKMVAEGSVKVFVNNVEFFERSFLTFEKEDIFEAQLASIPQFIRFGDGISGNVPQENADIRVRYLTTTGVKGNIPSDQITGLRFVLVVNLQTVSDIIIEQPDPALGGADFFSLSKAKALAPFVFKALDRAVTVEDYTALSNTFIDPDVGAVGKAKAIVVRSVDDDFVLLNFLSQMKGIMSDQFVKNVRDFWDSTVSGSCKANVVEVSVLTTDAEGRYRPAPAALLKKLEKFLNDRKEATVDIRALDGSSFIVPFDLKVTIDRDIGFSQAAVSTSVRDAILEFLRKKNFGDSVRLGDLFQVVEEVDGVKFSRIEITFPVTAGDGVPIPGLEPAFFENGDFVTGKLQIIEPRNIVISFL